MLSFALPVLGLDDPFVPPLPGRGFPGAPGEIMSVPTCFNVINQAPYTVTGTVMTETFTDDKGRTSRHRVNFRLEPAQTTNICAAGPFFAERRLELTIRTLIPVFSCKTKIDQDIVIQGRRKPEGGTETFVNCT